MTLAAAAAAAAGRWERFEKPGQRCRGRRETLTTCFVVVAAAENSRARIGQALRCLALLLSFIELCRRQARMYVGFFACCRCCSSSFFDLFALLHHRSLAALDMREMVIVDARDSCEEQRLEFQIVDWSGME